MAGFLQLSELDWKYKSEPQGTACLGKYTVAFFIKKKKIIVHINLQLCKEVGAIGPEER